MRRLVLASDADAVLAASAWLRALAQDERLSHDTGFRLDLCLTELVSNTVAHAHADGAAHRIEVDIVLDPEAVSVRLADDGAPFDPFAAETAALPWCLAEAEPGGAGLRLVREFCDSASYRRDGPHNIVEFAVLRARPRVPATSPPGDVGADAATPLIRAMARCDLFRDLHMDQLEAIAAQGSVRTAHDGEVLLRPGDTNRHVAVVLEGGLSIHLDTDSADEALVIGAGECVGEMSVVDASPVSALVTARGDCRILLIEAAAFLNHVLPLPSVAQHVLATLAARMRHGNRRIVAKVKEAAELDRVRRELALASQIQAAMVPHRSPLFPGHPRIDLSGRMRSAREVGGDLFDAFFVDPEHLFLVIGDVCGKGMPAALFMVRTLTLLRTEVQAIANAATGSVATSLGSIIASVNRTLFDDLQGELFVSLWCGVLEVSSGRLSCLNAGHLPPLLLRSGHMPSLLDARRNPIVGVVPDLAFEAFDIRFEAGDSLLLYTDGVTEATALSGDLFGDDRLYELTVDGDRGAAERLLDVVFDAVIRFTGEQAMADDLTVMCLRLGPLP